MYHILYVSEWQSLSSFWLFVTPWTVAFQAPLSMEFSRHKYWSELPSDILYRMPQKPDLTNEIFILMHNTNVKGCIL